MSTNKSFPLEGHCTCKTIQYRMETPPLIVNCCHCTYCQRESGSAFALNAVIESDRVTLLTSTEPELTYIPSFSGKGQDIYRCPNCRVAVWSQYPGVGPVLTYVRVGTMDRNDVLKAGVHIHTKTKMPWVDLQDSEVMVVEESYDKEKVWSEESLKRWAVVEPKILEHRAELSTKSG